MAECAVCGTPSPPPFRPPPAETAPDLDLRPGEPTRSTLPRWLSVCAGCGAVAPDLARLDRDTAAPIVASEAYRAASPERRWAMICPPNERGEALLQAAWAADDAGRDATELRLSAAEAWPAEDDLESNLRLVDILRRAGAFERADAQAALLAASGLDETSARLVSFQRARIAARDTGRHLISSALRPPATKPHVAHGRVDVKRGGFWSRLLGR